MTTSTPWQTVANTNNTPAFPLTKTILTTGMKAENKQNANQPVSEKKVVTTPRYSFDDNGGSYMGL